MYFILVFCEEGSVVKVRVVDSYKHLGTVVTPDHNNATEAANRSRSTMASFAPLAASIFGAANLSVSRRIGAAWSLAMSRLLYNVHV